MVLMVTVRSGFCGKSRASSTRPMVLRALAVGLRRVRIGLRAAVCAGEKAGSHPWREPAGQNPVKIRPK